MSDNKTEAKCPFSQAAGAGRTKKFLGECPQCGADNSISLLGSRSATLSSVASTARRARETWRTTSQVSTTFSCESAPGW